MSETIVRTFNIFCDSALGESGSTGSDYNLHLNTAGLNCDRGQFFRFTVKNFSMFKNFPNVNSTNNQFQIVTENTTANTAHQQSGSTLVTTGNLTKKNYKSVHSIADEFASKLASAINTHVTTNVTGLNQNLGSATISELAPDVSQKIIGDTDNVISFTITYTTAIPANVDIKCKLLDDTYALLGGNRVQKTDGDLFSSIEISIGTDRKIVNVQCHYPAQRMTSQFVYLRSSLNSNNLESNSLQNNNPNTTHGNHSNIHHSTIMGRFPIDNEFVQFDASTGREFIVDVPTASHVQNIRFHLTNERFKPIHELSIYKGSSTSKQNTLGNLNFSFALRVDVVQKFIDSKFTPEIVRDVYPRFSTTNMSTSKIEG